MKEIDFSKRLSLIIEDRGLTTIAIADVLKVPQSLVSQWKTGVRVPNIGQQKDIIEKIISVPPNKKNIFTNRVPFIENYNAYKANGKVNKGDIVHQFITVDLVDYISAYLRDEKFSELDYLNVTGSSGVGVIADSFWTAALDKRITRSTRTGIYPVILFDSTGYFLYQTIAFGVDSVSKPMKNLPLMTEEPKRILAKAIENERSYAGFTTDSIFLGTSHRAKLYEKSVIISKRYSIDEVDATQFLNDFKNLLDLYYGFVFDFFLESKQLKFQTEIEKFESNSSKHSIINPELYRALLKRKQEHNEKIGKEAEEFVLKTEKQRLNSLGRNDLAEKVKHLSMIGDGYGFDILSYEANGTKKYIEVKGSSLGASTFHFYLSKREKEVAEELGMQYVITLVENVTHRNMSIVAEIPYRQNSFEMSPVLFKCEYTKSE